MRKFIILPMLIVAVLCFCSCQTQLAELPAAPSTPVDVVEPVEQTEEIPTPFSEFSEKEIRQHYAKQGFTLEYFHFDSTFKNFALVAYKNEPQIYYTFELIWPDGEQAVVTYHHWLPVQATLWPPGEVELVVSDFFDDGGVYNDDEFPTRKIFWRATDFSSIEMPYYAPFHENYHIGKPGPARLTAIRFTSDGLNLEFGPQEGLEGDFYAGYASVPYTGFFFDVQSHSGTIVIENTVIGMDYSSMENDDHKRGAVLALSMDEQDGDTILTLQLNEQAVYYNVSYGCLLNYEPYLALRFSSDR